MLTFGLPRYHSYGKICLLDEGLSALALQTVARLLVDSKKNAVVEYRTHSESTAASLEELLNNDITDVVA